MHERRNYREPKTGNEHDGRITVSSDQQGLSERNLNYLQHVQHGVANPTGNQNQLLLLKKQSLQ